MFQFFFNQKCIKKANFGLTSLTPTWKHTHTLLGSLIAIHVLSSVQDWALYTQRVLQTKVAKRGLKACNFDETHVHDPTLSLSRAQGDSADDIHSAEWSSECMSPCVVLPSHSFRSLFQWFHWSNGWVVSEVRPGMGWERDVFLHEAHWKGITLLLPELCTCPTLFTFNLAWLSLIDNGNMGLDKCRYHTD